MTNINDRTSETLMNEIEDVAEKLKTLEKTDPEYAKLAKTYADLYDLFIRDTDNYIREKKVYAEMENNDAIQRNAEAEREFNHKENKKKNIVSIATTAIPALAGFGALVLTVAAECGTVLSGKAVTKAISEAIKFKK